MKFKNLLLVVFISAATALGSVWGYAKYEEAKYAGVQEDGKLPVNYASFYGKQDAADNSMDFTAAAASATPAVVHIKIQTKEKTVTNPNGGGDDDDPFGQLFGSPFGQLFGSPRTYRIPSQRASGSGVLITDDGYIITNNHVVQDADKITVTTSNKKTYTGRVIGTDPSSDLAVIKIDAKGLPYLVYGNSDNVKLGQWVLAIGYPFTLDVTVTAGIVSAKARDIGLGRQNSNGNAPSSVVESYIQTDAAVNPGNSGGALINTNGELIGINSAIASPTGAYSGYSFAIPVNIVKKVTADLIKYGAVQRGYMGLSFMDLSNASDKIKSQYNVKDYNYGLCVTDVAKDGAAAAAGLKSGDIITKVNGISVQSSGELSAIMGDKKPGDKLTVSYLRAGKENTTTMTLKNSLGDLTAVTAQDLANKTLGATLTTLSQQEANQNGLRSGVKVTGIREGAFKNAGVKEGFIITDANNTMIKTADQFNKIVQSSDGSVVVHGIYPNGEHIYGYRLNLASGNSNGDNNNTPDDDDDGN